MDSFIESLINGQLPSKQDINNFFYEICDREHASCNPECPVYAINNKVPNDSKSRSGCDCFKNGEAMIKFLRNYV